MEMTDDRGARAALNAQLDNPATAEALTRLLARLESLDKLAAWAERAVESGPALLGAAVEEVDHAHASPNGHAPDLDALLAHGPGLVQQLSSEKTLQALERLLARVDALEASTTMLVQAVESGPALVGGLVDRFDQLKRDPSQPTPDLDALMAHGPALTAKLTSPATLQALDGLLGRIDTLEESVSMLTMAMEGAPALITSLVDEADRRAAEMDMEGMVQEASDAFKQFHAWYKVGGLDKLRESGVFDPKTVEVIGSLSGSMLTSLEMAEREQKRVGAVGLMRALGDEDVQRAMGFLITFARQFGQTLRAR